jgi:hypothetical protein
MQQTQAEAKQPKLSIKRLVKTDIRIVEPMQMEASFEHRLMVKQGQDVVYPKRYKVESYFVFPPQMKVNKSTYRVENFYRDMKSFFNFRIPKLSYKEMMGLTDDPERSPLRKILAEISDESRPFNTQRQSFIEDEARIFACSFFTFLKRKVKRMQTILNELSRMNPCGCSTRPNAPSAIALSRSSISIMNGRRFRARCWRGCRVFRMKSIPLMNI